MDSILEANLMDKLEMFYNLLCFIFGVPMNLITLKWLLGRKRVTSSLLHIHLNISDLAVLFFYCFARFCWLVTYEWKAGQMTCKAMRFAESLSFSISSNILVSIAVNRYCALKHPIQVTINCNSFRECSTVHWEERVTALASFSWIFAVSFSLPQLFVWDVYNLDGNYTQCLNIWVKAKAELLFVEGHGFGNFSSDLEYLDNMVRLYEMYHLLVVFWIPLIVLICLYALIIREMYSSMALGADVNNGAVRPSFRFPSVPTAQLRRNSRNVKVLKRARWKALRITLILMTTYTLCWLPYNSLALWGVIDPGSYIEHENTVYIMHSLVVLNSVINPCIYGSTFRRAVCAHRRKPLIFNSVPVR
uniref:G-protein coupled receptors family 1 profile domain-containing protein n=1 Tax=Ascaris lumbricoides TaxID=6252 RepID=A0A9J2PYT2_ASCLU